MSEHLFGLGRGYLPKLVDRAARKHGAYLVNYSDAGCSCGYGCRDNCPENRRHWFAGPSQGSPFDEALEKAVLGDPAVSAAIARAENRELRKGRSRRT